MRKAYWAFVFCIVYAATAFAQDTSQQQWSPISPLPQPAFFENSAVAINGKMYVVTSKAVFEYDPKTNQWAQYKAELARHDFETVALNGKLYVIGGCGGGDQHIRTGAVDEFDPVHHTWRSRAPLPTPRMAMGVVAVGGKIYAIGGLDPNKTISAVEVYDPATDSWTKKRDWSRANTNAVAVQLVPGKIHVLAASPTAGALEEYDIAGDTFRTLPNPRTPRHCAAVAVIAGRLVTVGGHVSDDQALSTVEAYDPAMNTWVGLADLPEARSCPAGAELGGKFYVVGGSAPAAWKNKMSSAIAIESGALMGAR